MPYNPNIHNRRSIRLKGYDYSQEGLYFITIVCKNREYLFGKTENQSVILNNLGEIADTEWLNTINIRKNIILHEYIIMPNHMHGIIEIVGGKGEGDDVKGVLQYAPTELTAPTDLTAPGDHTDPTAPANLTATIKKAGGFQSPSKTIGAIIRGYKGAVTKQINIIRKTLGTPVWQRNYWEHIIRNEAEYNRIANYIINNPEN